MFSIINFNSVASCTLPAVWGTKIPLGMTTLSSEFLAQSTIPFRPFMGKLLSVITDTAGNLCILATKKSTRKSKRSDHLFPIPTQDWKV